MSLMRLVTTFSPKSKILTKKNDNLDLFETTVYVQIFSNVSYFSSLFLSSLTLPATATDERKAADGQSPFCIGRGDTGCWRNSSRTASGWNRG